MCSLNRVSLKGNLNMNLIIYWKGWTIVLSLLRGNWHIALMSRPNSAITLPTRHKWNMISILLFWRVLHASQYQWETALINSIILHHHSFCHHSHHGKMPKVIRQQVHQCLKWISSEKFSKPVCLACWWHDLTRLLLDAGKWEKARRRKQFSKASSERHQGAKNDSYYCFSSGSGTIQQCCFPWPCIFPLCPQDFPT